MGVDHTVYAVVGVIVTDKDKMKYVSDTYYDNVDFFESRSCDVDVIMDGMSGKYVVLGRILCSFDKYGEGRFSTIELPYPQNDKLLAMHAITEHFPELGYTLHPETAELHIFSHFS